MKSFAESLTKSFEPTTIIKVENLANEKVPMALLLEVHKFLERKYSTLLDTKKGTIYLKKKSSAQVLKNRLEEGDKEIEGYSELKDQENKLYS